jgi:uncharacterized damage-inducible protein DinB
MTSTSAAAASNISAAYIAEMEQEAAITRRCLERVPEEKFDWKPHEKSMALGQLASHIAEMFSWTKSTMESDVLDFATADYKPFQPKSNAELLEFFDKNVADAIETLRNASDEDFMKPWTLKNGERTYFTLPKTAIVRGFVLSHVIHHRGQLSVYLRLNDVAVPQIYGPSADEGEM